MNQKCVLIRYSEIALKGKNRNLFEKRLIENIRLYLKRKNIGFEKIERTHSRILIYTDEMINLKPIFGIASYSHAKYFEFDYEKLKEESLRLAKKSLKEENTFRVSVQRIDKSIKHKSTNMEREIGGVIFENLKNNVSLKEYDKKIGIELIEGKAYVFTDRIDCFGGLPLGVDESSSLLIENNYSVLAALLMMRRGIFFEKIFIKDKKVSLRLIEEYNNIDKQHSIINVINRKDCYQKLNEMDNNSIIVNDSLEDLDMLDKEYEILILRPLIGLNRKKIEERLKVFEESLR